MISIARHPFYTQLSLSKFQIDYFMLISPLNSIIKLQDLFLVDNVPIMIFSFTLGTIGFLNSVLVDYFS